MKAVAGLDVGIDLGTSRTTVYIKGKGIVMSESTAICYDSYTDEVIAVGNSAGQMLERMPDTVELSMPIKNGAIADFSVVQQLLTLIIEKICKNRIFKPNVIISTPAGTTALQKKTIVDVACASGAGKVALIDEPVAAALGAGITIENPHGTMVVDIGAGTSDIAVITMGTIAVSSTFPVAGDKMDEAICQYLKRERDIVVGTPTARKIKHIAGCAYLPGEEIEMAANGKNYITGLPEMFTVTSSEVYLAMRECIESIMEEMRRVLEQTPPELYSDICHEGIYLTGGGSCLRGLAEKMKERFQINVHVTQDGANCAAKGAGYALKDMDTLEDKGLLFKMNEKLPFGML